MDKNSLAPIIVSGDKEELGVSLSAIIDYITSAASLARLEKDAVYRLKLAVDEIATNILMHGYNGNSLAGTIRVSATIDENTLTIALEDSGIPYDPRQQAVPQDLDDPLELRQIGGLGVYLALQSVDQFDYERLNNQNINRFTMKREPKANGG